MSRLRKPAGTSAENGMQEPVREEEVKAESKHGIPRLFVPRKETSPAVEENKYIAIEE